MIQENSAEIKVLNLHIKKVITLPRFLKNIFCVYLAQLHRLDTDAWPDSPVGSTGRRTVQAKGQPTAQARTARRRRHSAQTPAQHADARRRTETRLAPCRFLA